MPRKLRTVKEGIDELNVTLKYIFNGIVYRMDTNQLKIFVTYSQTQNLRMTADLHHTSHVAVIRALKSLEDQTGLKLTMRVGRGSVLTEAGKSLVAVAERMLAEERNLLNFAKTQALHQSEFRIATFEVFSSHLAPEINSAVGLGHRMSWLEKIPGEIEQAVRLGVADIGITYLPVPTPDVEHLKVSSIRMGLFQGLEPQYAETKLEMIPFVIPAQSEFSTPSKAKGLDGWPDHRIPRNIHYKVSLLETALALVAAGQCIGYFPSFVVKLFNLKSQQKLLTEVSSVKVGEPSQDVFLVKRLREDETPTIKKVTKVLRALR